MFRNVLMRGVSAGAMTLAMLSPVAAQVALPPIEIDAERARRSAQDASTPLATSEIVGEKLDAARPAYSDTTQLLRDAPGVSFYEGGGVSRLPALRGLADDRIKILLGGTEVTSACGNHMNPPLSYIDPNNVGKIEVISGVTPVSKGGDSIAGTIRVEPKPPVFASQVRPNGQWTPPWNSPNLFTSGSISAFYRSTNDGYTVSGTANAATGNFSLLYNGSYTRGSDYHMGDNGPKVLSTSFISENHSATLAYQNEGHLFTLRGGYQNIPFQAWPNVRMDMSGIPGRGSGNTGYSVDAGYAGAYEWGKLDAKAYWRHTAHIMNFLYDKLPAAMPMYTAGTDFGYSIKAEIPLSARDTLRLGNEFHGNRLNDWWEPVPGGMKGMMGPNTLWNINGGKRDRLGTFAEWEAKWTPQWTSLLGVRNDTVWMDTGLVQPYGWDQMIRLGPPAPLTNARDAALFNAQGHSRTDINFDVTALLRYQPDEGSAYEAGYARKTRSPNLYERYAWNYGYSSDMVGWFGDANGYVGNLGLKPEVAHTFNVTAAWRDAVGDNWEAKVSPYFSYVENFIDADKIGQFNEYGNPAGKYYFPGGFTFPILQFRNHRAELYGFDVSGRVKLSETPEFGRFDLSGVISYVHGKNLDTGDGLYFIMPLNARFSLDHRLGRWSNGLEVQFVDSKTHVAVVRNEFKTPGYAILNLRSSYEWDNLRIDVGIQNVTDARYFPPLGGFYYAGYKPNSYANSTPLAYGPVPGLGRSYYAGVTVKF